jgi:hypothetical protein
MKLQSSTICREGFPKDEDEENPEEDLNEVSHVEDLNETFDEDEVLIYALPLDEDIQAFAPSTYQEENMMSCDPFEDLNDTLFHEFGSEEVLEEPLDETNPFKMRQTKHSVLRIKPLVMKRRQRGMYIKRKKNYDESQHVETSLSLLSLDEGEVVQPCFPPVHEIEESISLNDEEIQDPVEAALASILPAHKDKEMVIFSHIGGLMKEIVNMVDENIDTFIQTGRHTWDFGRFIFDRDPIYDIDGSSQRKGVDLSCLEDWSSLPIIFVCIPMIIIC